MAEAGRSASVVEALRSLLGSDNVLVDADLRAPFETDWMRRFHGEAAAVVRPADAAEVSAVVRLCGEAGLPIVTQGGNTGLVGGGVPSGGEVVLATTRLRHLGAVDPATAEIEVGAGVALADLQAAARAAGFDAGLDFAARDSATVGGIAATDAGGIRAIRHGTARARIAGIEAVLGDGSLVRHDRAVLKDNAGYPIHQLLIGSEGTLGVITKVRWRLVPAAPVRAAALVALPSLQRLLPLLVALRAKAPSLEAVEFMVGDGMRLVADHLGLPLPLDGDAPVFALVECADRRDPLDELAAALEEAGCEDAVVASDSHDRERLWRFREAHTEAISAAGVPHKLDVGVPVGELGRFLGEVPDRVEAVAPGARTYLFGHLGDGNVHVNVLGPDPGEGAVDEAVLGFVAELGGTISAEHGIGRLKGRWLGLSRSPQEIAAMRRLKLALDPHGILNPGAVIESEGKESA